MQRKRESMSLQTNAKAGESGWRETIKIVVHALILAMIVRIFFYQPFNIPSGSMKSTLLVGDYLFVSKLSYGYSRYSFPWGIIPFNGRIFGAEPKRGDVAVFKLPRDNSTDFIKRVIGLPGDEIAVRGGVLYINGQAVPKVRKGDFVSPEEDRPIPRYEETLPNGVKYFVLDSVPNGQFDNVSGLQGAGRPLLHDGRQPRQLHRQPRAVAALWRRLRALREPGRTRRDHLLLGRRRRSQRLPADQPLDLALRHSLGPDLQPRALV